LKFNLVVAGACVSLPTKRNEANTCTL